MNYIVIFSKSALADIEEISNWYDEQRTGLGEEFIDETFVCASYLEQNAETFSCKFGIIREIPLKRFPYLLAYYVSGSEAVVLSVSHFRRETRRKKTI